MKIAICISGLYRSKVKPDPDTLQKKLKSAFPTADFFYHTWDDRKNDVPTKYWHALETCVQPIPFYHPINDSLVVNDHGKFKQYREKKTKHQKQMFASLQLLGYADLIDKVPSEYDLIIRARWDTLINNKIDYSDYLQKAYEEGPVGFMTRFNRGPVVNQNKLIEIPKNTKAVSDDWYCYLPDVMIFHHRKHIDTQYVRQLHKEKKLWSAEWGWYQILSQPYGDIHTSVHGGVMIAR